MLNRDGTAFEAPLSKADLTGFNSRQVLLVVFDSRKKTAKPVFFSVGESPARREARRIKGTCKWLHASELGALLP